MTNHRLDSVRKQAYDMRLAALTAPAADGKTLEHYRDQINNATSADTASLVLDEARDVLQADDMAELQKAFTMAWEV